MPGKHCWNRNVLSKWRKYNSDSAEKTLLGKLCQIRGTAVKKALTPTVDSLRVGIIKQPMSVERSARLLGANASSSRCSCTVQEVPCMWCFLLSFIIVILVYSTLVAVTLDNRTLYFHLAAHFYLQKINYLHRHISRMFIHD